MIVVVGAQEARIKATSQTVMVFFVAIITYALQETAYL